MSPTREKTNLRSRSIAMIAGAFCQSTGRNPILQRDWGLDSLFLGMRVEEDKVQGGAEQF